MLINYKKSNYENVQWLRLGIQRSLATGEPYNSFFCDKSPGYLPFPFSLVCALQGKILKISMLFRSHMGFMWSVHT